MDIEETLAAIATEVKTMTDGYKADKAAATARMDDIEKRVSKNRLMGGGAGTDDAALKAELKSLGVFCRTGNDAELKAMSVGDDPSGGYFVTPALSTSITKRLFDHSPVRKLARVITIGAGDAFEEPVDTSDVGASWVGENDSRPETTESTVGVVRIPVEELYGLQKVTRKLLEDASFDIGQYVSDKVTDKFSRSEGVAFATGDGVKKPRGFLTYGTSTADDLTRANATLQYFPSGAASTITADALRDMYWGLRAVHRSNGTWMMSSAVANVVDKLKDGDGQYLWRPGLTANAPPTLLGKPVEFNEDMQAVSAGNYPLAFGDWSAYCVVDKPGVRFIRDELTAKPFVVFYLWKRVGGGVLDFDKIKLMKIGVS